MKASLQSGGGRLLAGLVILSAAAAIDEAKDPPTTTTPKPEPEPEPSRPWWLKLLIWVWNALVDILLVFLIIVCLPLLFFIGVYLIVLLVIQVLLPPLAELPGVCWRGIGQILQRIRQRPVGPVDTAQTRCPTTSSASGCGRPNHVAGQPQRQGQPVIPRNMLRTKKAQQPLSASATAALTRGRTERSQQETCAICLEGYSSREARVGVLPCLHAFHIGCINWALQVRQHCPVCNRSVTLHDCVVKQPAEIGHIDEAYDVDEATPLLR